MKIVLFCIKSPCGFPFILLLTKQGPGKTVTGFCDQQLVKFPGKSFVLLQIFPIISCYCLFLKSILFSCML